MTEKQLNNETNNEVKEQQETVQAAEETKQPETPAKEKTAEELALEQGYYACCFRSH